MTAPFSVGQTVRLCAELRTDAVEHGGIAGHRMTGFVGRVTAAYHEDGFCGLCDFHGVDCAGPWYGVDFGDGPSGMYAGHELEAA